MDRKKLEENLLMFCQACQEAGKKIEIEGTSEAYPGASNTSYFVHIRGLDWANGMPCSRMLDEIIPLLYETLDKETIKHIFALNVSNLSQEMNCHYPVTFEEYAMAC